MLVMNSVLAIDRAVEGGGNKCKFQNLGEEMYGKKEKRDERSLS